MNYAAQAGQVGTLQGSVSNTPKPPQPPISQALLMELLSLLEKARMIENRQVNLKDRIFGPSPCVPESGQKDSQIVSNGFLQEANEKIQALHNVMDRMIQNCTDLERLA